MAKGYKTGGREKGTQNKLTRELRLVVKDLVDDELQLLPKHLDDLEVKDRVEVLLKLIPYVLPRVLPVSMKAGEPIDFDPTVF